MTEKISFKNSRKLKLVGILYPNKSNNAVIMAHSFTSNKDRLRSVKIAGALHKNGFAVLRFDFSGSGESNDDLITVENQVDDLKHAMSFMKERGYSKLGLLGESLGGLVSLMCYNEEIKTMVLLAPVTKKVKSRILNEKSIADILEEKGYIIKFKDGKSFKIPKKYFEERESVNQEEILSKVKCPVLIMHGDQDDSVPIEDSKDSINLLLVDSQLEIIKGMGHKLDAEPKIIKSILNWFEKFNK